MYVNTTARRDYDEMISFARRVKKFRESLKPGMTLKVHPSTDSQTFDKKTKLAKVVEIYKHYVHLQDDDGFNYGPTYQTLLMWGNN